MIPSESWLFLQAHPWESPFLSVSWVTLLRGDAARRLSLWLLLFLIICDLSPLWAPTFRTGPLNSSPLSKEIAISKSGGGREGLELLVNWLDFVCCPNKRVVLRKRIAVLREILWLSNTVFSSDYAALTNFKFWAMCCEHTPVIPALGKLGEECESMTAWAT